jgi:hypothetical protein
MSRPGTSKTSFAAIVARWEALLAGAEANRDDLPALEQYRGQLEAALKDTREIHERRLSQESEARRLTQEARALLQLGRDLAAQLESGVLLLYGRRSPKLAEFGVKAVPRSRKKTAPRCGVKGCPLGASATAK